MILLGIFELILLYGGQICNKVTKNNIYVYLMLTKHYILWYNSNTSKFMRRVSPGLQFEVQAYEMS